MRNSLQTAFKRGLRGDTPGYERTSLTYAAWAAGRDTRKAKLPWKNAREIAAGGEWIVQENRDGIQGWVELFRGEDGKLYSIPDATRFISLR